VRKKLQSICTKRTRVVIGQFPQASTAEGAFGRKEKIDQRS
jgi:hypothetical protein